jgi:hypothetical protein
MRAVALFGILVAAIIMNIGIWKTLEKGGISGTNLFVPIRNMRMMIRLAGLEGWKIPPLALLLGPALLSCIPFGIARQFGKGRLFGLGLLLLPFIFFPILGFGRTRYLGNSKTG